MAERSRLKSWQQRDRLSRQYQLPSCGWLYGDLNPTGVVTMSSVRGEDEEIIGGAGEGPEAIAVLREKIEQLVATGRLPYYQLLFSDWIALLFNFMAFSYGSDMRFSVRCPHCKQFPPEPYVFALEKLPCVVLDEHPAFDKKTFHEPFTTPKLPPYDDVINFRLLRLEDMLETEKYYKQGLRAGMQGDFVRSYAMARHIVGINGEEVNTFEALDYVRHGTTGATLLAMRRAFNEVEPGYSLLVDLECGQPSCRAQFQVHVPEDGSFFRPKSDQHRVAAKAAFLDAQQGPRRTKLPGLGSDDSLAEGGLHPPDEQVHQGEEPQDQGEE